MNARFSSLISKFKKIRLIEVAIAIAVIVGVVVAGRMFSLYKEGAENQTTGTDKKTDKKTGPPTVQPFENNKVDTVNKVVKPGNRPPSLPTSN